MKQTANPERKGARMFIDYITLMLVNMAAGLLLLGLFVLVGLKEPNRTPWSPAFGMVGLVALATGLHMTLTWPLPKLETWNAMWANIAYGELTVLFGVLFLAAALATAKGWHLLPTAIYGLSAGVVAIAVGLRIGGLGLTNAPTVSAVGFFLTGLGGILLVPVVLMPRSLSVRLLVAIDLFAAAGLWCFSGLMGYWSHLAKFSATS